MKKVLVADSLSKAGIEMLEPYCQVDVKTGLKEEELIDIIGEYDGMIVRSQTKVTPNIIKAGKKLQIIGRAGVGVDNINLEEATRCGVIVVNAPTGNTISATEHSIALMLCLARHIPQANAALKAGQWKRSAYMGTEVKGKTLGIVGLGNIGAEVAKRARSLEMNLIGYDPFVSTEYAQNLKVEIVSYEELLKRSDFITLHVPLNDATRGMIGAKEFEMVKPNLRIVNAARGGLIDEEALIAALKEKKLAGAAIDVFPKEPCTESPLFELDNIIVTPHLGASTTEAQALAATDVAEQFIDFFNGQSVKYPVNAPFIPPQIAKAVKPYMEAGDAIGKLASQIVEGQVKEIHIKYEGELSNYETTALKASVLGGLLNEISEERVNTVNANIMATKRGLKVVEQKEASCENYASIMTVELTSSAGTTTISATVLRGDTHIVRINDYWVDFIPSGGYFMLIDHTDKPGIIGSVGRVTGDANINISSMYVSRLQKRGKALMILVLDEALTEEGQKAISAMEDVQTAKLVKL